ncbi:MAG: hypothetical protein L6R38_007476 [Xanthoria sp. 2 TBL-2021]|nr:MAG: hypothetical protein L6R38_007476 [Xanthoria sp. 2 TBL-2021]
MASKAQKKISQKIGEKNAWKKFTDPTVSIGRTAFPKDPKRQQSLGVRFDLSHKEQRADGVYNTFQMQPNDGKIDFFLKNWRDSNGGTHATMATVTVKEGGTKDEVLAAILAAFEALKTNAGAADEEEEEIKEGGKAAESSKPKP